MIEALSLAALEDKIVQTGTRAGNLQQSPAGLPSRCSPVSIPDAVRPLKVLPVSKNAPQKACHVSPPEEHLLCDN